MDKIIFLGLGIFLNSISLAQTVNSNANAIKQTQSVLTNQKQRQAVINQSPDAKSADAYASQVVGGGQNLNQAYDIASALVPWIVAQSNGDPMKMQQMLNAAQADPQGFLNKMPASERDKIKALAAASPKPAKP